MENNSPLRPGKAEVHKTLFQLPKKPDSQALKQEASQNQDSDLIPFKNRTPVYDTEMKFKHIWPVQGSAKYEPNSDLQSYEKKINLTPSLAETWRQSTLAVEARIGHRLNRNANLRRIASLSEMIKAGQFPYVGDTIKLSPPDSQTKEPVILDGWHRICAVIKAQISVEVLVVFNLSPHLFSYMDIGRSRSAGDILAINGVPGQNFIAGAARMVHLFERRGILPNQMISNPEILNVVSRHQGLIRWVELIRKSDKPLRKSVILACCYWIERTNDPRAPEFLDAFLSMDLLSPGSPIKALRRRIINEPTLWSVSTQRFRLIALFFRSWHHFIQGEKVDHLKAKGIIWPGGAPYLDFPIVKELK